MNKLLVGLFVFIVGIGIGWYVLGYQKPKEQGTGNATEKSGVRLSDIANTVVTYADTGFVPATITVKKGTTVTFVNGSSGRMWVASNPHPTHTDLPGFDELGGVQKNGMYEYAFTKVGTWKYHNHLAPVDTGTVTVTE